MSEIPHSQFPKVDRNAILEEESRKALAQMLPAERFLLRLEAGRDAGVDAYIELFAGGYSLNIRAQVQLKGTDSTEENADGSISLSVAVANLNYLLNGPSPLYVLHVNPTNEIRLAWAWDEKKRLDSQGKDWSEKEVALRFLQVLDGEECDRLWERIFREGQLQRKAREAISSAGALNRVALSVDVRTLELITGTQAYDVLNRQGCGMVASGKAEEVLKLYRRLEDEQSERARIQLIVGYAYAMLGRYITALGHFANARLSEEGLSRDDVALLDHLYDSCELSCGRMGVGEYVLRQEAAAAKSDDAFALHLRLESARQAPAEHGEEGIEHLRRVALDVASSNVAGGTLRFQAQAILLDIQGRVLSRTIAHELMLFKARLKMGIAAAPIQVLVLILTSVLTWEQEMEVSLKDPRMRLNARFEAEALTTRALVRFLYLSSLGLLDKPLPNDIIALTEADLDSALTTYHGLGDLEGELRTKMLQADFRELAGDEASARLLADEVLPKAKAVGYVAMSDKAASVLRGDTMTANRRKTRVRLETTDQDFMLAEHSDEEIADWASFSLEASRLPPDRLPNVVEDVLGLREEARMKVGWCRHFELFRRKGHERHRATMYRERMKWSCACEARGIGPDEDTMGFDLAITLFKARHCESCGLRSPKSADGLGELV